MGKTEVVVALDAVQSDLKPMLKAKGFRSQGRTFNRKTEDGLIQVIHLQAGASDPPGTTYIPGLRENLYGRFTVNLGVYIPEIAVFPGSGEAKAWVQEVNCCIRNRLSMLTEGSQDMWWAASPSVELIQDLEFRLTQHGLPFLDQFSSRDKILLEWKDQAKNPGFGAPPRIVCAIIYASRGKPSEAKVLLSAQALEIRNPGHAEHVRALARKLGIGALDG